MLRLTPSRMHEYAICPRKYRLHPGRIVPAAGAAPPPRSPSTPACTSPPLNSTARTGRPRRPSTRRPCCVASGSAPAMPRPRRRPPATGARHWPPTARSGAHGQGPPASPGHRAGCARRPWPGAGSPCRWPASSTGWSCPPTARWSPSTTGCSPWVTSCRRLSWPPIWRRSSTTSPGLTHLNWFGHLIDR